MVNYVLMLILFCSQIFISYSEISSHSKKNQVKLSCNSEMFIFDKLIKLLYTIMRLNIIFIGTIM